MVNTLSSIKNNDGKNLIKRFKAIELAQNVLFQSLIKLEATSYPNVAFN